MTAKQFLEAHILLNKDCKNAKVNTIEKFFEEWSGDYDFTVSGDFDSKLVGMKVEDKIIGYRIFRNLYVEPDSLCFLVGEPSVKYVQSADGLPKEKPRNELLVDVKALYADILSGFSGEKDEHIFDNSPALAIEQRLKAILSKYK